MNKTMKKEFSDIYSLLWELYRIARSVSDLNGCIAGDLMIDAFAIGRMREGEERLWHVGKGLTWMSDSEDEFPSSMYRIKLEGKIYSIEKIK